MGLTAVLVGRVLVRLVTVGQGCVVVLLLVVGRQVCSFLAARMGHVGVLVIVTFGVVVCSSPNGQEDFPLDSLVDPLFRAGGVGPITTVAGA